MKDGMIKYIAKGAIGAGLVAAPAFGGQLVSGIAKAKVAAIAGLPNAVVDAGGCTAVAVAEVGAMALIGGKKAMARTIPLALAGILLGTALPAVDEVIDGWVRSAGGGATAQAQIAATSTTAPKPAGVGRALMDGSGVPVPGGYAGKGSMRNVTGDVWTG